MLLSRYQVVRTNEPQELVDGLMRRQPWMRDVSVRRTNNWRYEHNLVRLGTLEISTSASAGVSYASDSSGSITIGLVLAGEQVMSVGAETRRMTEMASFLPIVPVRGVVRQCRFALVRLNRARLLAMLESLEAGSAESVLCAYLTQYWLQMRPGLAALDSALRFLLQHIDRFGPPLLPEARALEDLVYAHAGQALIGPASVATDRASSGAFARCVEFIADNLESDISVLDVAGAGGLSLRSTQALFQRLGHSTITGYIREARLAQARTLLQARRPGDTVLSVSLQVGFNHISYFTRAYRATYGETPGETLRCAR